MKNMILIPIMILVGGAIFAFLFKAQQNSTASGVCLLISIIGGVWFAVDIVARLPFRVKTTDSQK